MLFNLLRGAAAALLGFVSLQVGSLTAHPHVVPRPVAAPAFAVHVDALGGFFSEERVPNVEVPSPPPAPAAAEPDPAPAAPVPQPVAAPPPPRVTVPAPAPAPAPAIVVGSAQQALINQDRAAAGLPPLTWSSCLGGIAAQAAAGMAQAGRIFHNGGAQQDWGCGLNPVQTGENVGEWGGGVNDAAINSLFMGSADHRANILGPYHYVGTAWVVANGVGYIAVEFA